MKTYAEKCKIVADFLEAQYQKEKTLMRERHGIRNYSQNSWASDHHFSSPSMSQWILGHRLPEAPHIYQMATEFGEEILDLLGEEFNDRDGFIRFMIEDRPTPDEERQLLSLYRKLKALRGQEPTIKERA